MGPPLQENSLTTAEIGLRPEFTYKAPAKKDDQKLHGWVACTELPSRSHQLFLTDQLIHVRSAPPQVHIQATIWPFCYTP